MLRSGGVQKAEENHLQIIPDRITQVDCVRHDDPWFNQKNVVGMGRLQGCLKFSGQFFKAWSAHAPHRAARNARNFGLGPIMVSIDTVVNMPLLSFPAPFLPLLQPPERLDRIEGGGLTGGLETEEKTDGDRGGDTHEEDLPGKKNLQEAEAGQ